MTNSKLVPSKPHFKVYFYLLLFGPQDCQPALSRPHLLNISWLFFGNLCKAEVEINLEDSNRILLVWYESRREEIEKYTHNLCSWRGQKSNFNLIKLTVTGTIFTQCFIPLHTKWWPKVFICATIYYSICTAIRYKYIFK